MPKPGKIGYADGYNEQMTLMDEKTRKENSSMYGKYFSYLEQNICAMTMFY